MTVTFELWHLISLALALAGMFTGLGRVLLVQFERRMDERFKVLHRDSERSQYLEREFFKLRAELPDRYVRREDYIRGQTVIEAKLDAINNKVDLVKLRGAQGG